VGAPCDELVDGDVGDELHAASIAAPAEPSTPSALLRVNVLVWFLICVVMCGSSLPIIELIRTRRYGVTVGQT
jgi:hypothetical protein